ncbi:MAG: single-stranded DNA-binding protein [Chitinophagaceae bacterium]|nr:single-stranded DNA-binding protein [Chitinophagaceae bacterium]
MEITGRLTADATVSTTKKDRQVVNFSIAINDSYRQKDTGELKEITTYIDCAYWLSAKVTSWLRKGALVQLYGRIGMNVYNDMEGKAVGSLNFHVKDIKLLAFPKKGNSNTEAVTPVAAGAAQGSGDEKDNLPF